MIRTTRPQQPWQLATRRPATTRRVMPLPEPARLALQALQADPPILSAADEARIDLENAWF